MKRNDFLLCTFEGDTAQFAGEITEVNNNENTFGLSLSVTEQRFTFSRTEPWTGTDDAGQNYILTAHDVFTAGNTDPFPQGAAVVTFSDGKRYLCYVNGVDPSLVITFYHDASIQMTIEQDVVTISAWELYPPGEKIMGIEGYVSANDAVVENTETSGSGNSTENANGAGSENSQFFIVDVYAGDLGGKPDWEVLANTPRFYGGIIKATEGIGYNGGNWFTKNWPAVKDSGKKRYGSTWFRGAYLFLQFRVDGAKQADYYLDTIDAAGGWSYGDMIPIIDVELGNDGRKDPKKRNPNQDASAQQIIDCTTACAERIRSRTGRRVMLYGRGAMRDKGIHDRMGCDIVWNPCYTKTLVMNGLDAWTLDDVALWQYCGDGDAVLDEKIFPRSIAGFGSPDISVYIDGARKPTLSSLIQRLGIGT